MFDFEIHTDDDLGDIDEEIIFVFASISRWVRALLNRGDLTCSEMRMVIRLLFSMFSTQEHRRLLRYYMERRGLMWRLDDTSEKMSARLKAPIFFDSLNKRCESLEIETDDFLLTIWAYYLAVAQPGQPIPILEYIDRDAPYFAPIGVEDADPSFIPNKITAEMNAKMHFGNDYSVLFRP